jgi:mitogen-activated protein kinase kinase kinase
MTIMDSVAIIRHQLKQKGEENTELIQACYAFATEFGKRSSSYVDANRRAMNNARLVELSLEWVSFICDDCDASDRKTFKWAVAALEFAMAITWSNHLLSMDNDQYAQLRVKVAGCMSVLISHFDIMGARSTLAAQAESKRLDESRTGSRRYGAGRILDDDEAMKLVREQRLSRIAAVEDLRIEEDAKRQALGKVLEGSNEADRSLTVLSLAEVTLVPCTLPSIWTATTLWLSKKSGCKIHNLSLVLPNRSGMRWVFWRFSIIRILCLIMVLKSTVIKSIFSWNTAPEGPWLVY